MGHVHIPNLSGILNNSRMPLSEASVRIHSLCPFFKIAALHFVLFGVLAFRLQHHALIVQSGKNSPLRGSGTKH